MASSQPNLICENSRDYYTISSSSKGNKALNYPIGLITVDEIMLAGSSGGIFDGEYNFQKISLNNYLITGYPFWSMTPVGGYIPFSYADLGALVFNINDRGSIDDTYVHMIFYFRPVINIRSNVKVSGDGTIQNPYNFAL